MERLEEMEKLRKTGSSRGPLYPPGIKAREVQQSSANCTRKELCKKRESWAAKKGFDGNSMRTSPSKTLSACKPSRPKCLGTTALENGYQPQPERRFSAADVRALMRTVLEEGLRDVQYGGDRCSALAVELAEQVKKAAKGLYCERYKIICFVVLGPVKQTEVSCCSRSVWCPAADTYVEYCFKNSSLFALCLLFAVYLE